MTEFWKSNPKKFCDFCKVWFADNKSSIDFHERGKKHQENVQRKLGELRKKGLKQHEQQQHTDSYMQQMEEAALKAFKKDAERDSSLVSQYNQAAVEFKVKQFQEEAGKELKSSKAVVWYEGKDDDGCSYYWNDDTGESKWEQPADFVPYQDPSGNKSEQIRDQPKDEKEEEAGEEAGGEAREEAGEEAGEESKEKGENDAPKGQKRKKSDAYGQWTEVTEEDSTPVDLQLPKSTQNYISQYQPQVEQRQPEEEIEFGTKTITSLGPASSTEKANIGFKKRKTKGGGRSLRQRDEVS